MRLEFALTVTVAAVIAALALERIAELQVSADGARAQTAAAQGRSTAALAQAREPLPSSSAAAMPCRVNPSSEPLTGAATGILSPSCQ
jgi:hypothetical protein